MNATFTTDQQQQRSSTCEEQQQHQQRQQQVSEQQQSVQVATNSIRRPHHSSCSSSINNTDSTTHGTAMDRFTTSSSSISRSTAAARTKEALMASFDVGASSTTTARAQQEQQQQANMANIMSLTADQFSSSLASIASCSARQALHHQQSSSSSDTSSSSNNSNQAMVVTTSATETTTTNSSSSGSGADNSNTSANHSNSSSGSGGDDRDWGVTGQDAKKPPPLSSSSASSALHHHAYATMHVHHPHARSGKRTSLSMGGCGDDFGLPLEDPPRWHNSNAAASRHATVVARLPPPADSSSSGNETSFSGPSSSLLQPHREPAYHTIKQTLLQRRKASDKKKLFQSSLSSGQPILSSSSNGGHGNKLGSTISSKKKKSKQKQSETTSSDSSGEPAVHKRHQYHGSKRPAPQSSNRSAMDTEGSKKKKKSIKQGPGDASASAQGTAAASVARKKRPHPDTSRNDDDDDDGPAAKKTIMKPPTATEAEEDENYQSNSSSGSGTEAGYAGSASSNDNVRKNGDPGSSSNSNASSDIADFSSGASEVNAYAFGTSPSNSPSLSSSNYGDDYEDDDDSSEDDANRKQATSSSAAATSTPAHSRQWPPTHLSQTSVPLVEDRKLSVNVSGITAMAVNTAQSQFAKISRGAVSEANGVVRTNNTSSKSKGRRSSFKTSLLQDKPSILNFGSDLMAHVLTFLEPPEILGVLTMPLSKEWHATFANQQELWRVLCLLEPFKAQVEEDFSSSSSSAASSSSGDDETDDDGSLSSVSGVAPAGRKNWKVGTSSLAFRAVANPNSGSKPTPSTATGKKKQSLFPKFGKLGRYRHLYTSFVRCMLYLERMKDDVLHGRPPSAIDDACGSNFNLVMSTQAGLGQNRSLQQFLAGARGVVESQRRQQRQPSAAVGNARDEGGNSSEDGVSRRANEANMPILSSDDGSNSYPSSVERRRKKCRNQSQRKRPKFGRSMLTDRLLAPAPSGDVNPENVALPWSCALYSIVNWMVAFADVEGIQVMCLKVLPHLLEDEQQRITAQRVGLTDVILRGMVLFPESVQLHTASFHTLVLLARPLGGREGMLFHSAMVNAAGIFSGGEARNSSNAGAGGTGNGEDESVFRGGAQSDGKNGIAVMLDSMRRFEDDEALQAMSCWSLVNIALAPVQKEVLVKLGGIEVTTNAMMRHPHNAEVQFRALFALINLVIPSVNVGNDNGNDQANPGDANDGFAEELNEMVGQITSLVVLAMKNFCSSEAILNRACLVLHNLSLTQAYHSTLLWTPNCYQMLEWCLANYRTDQVLQQSAAGTLHRLQVTLSNDENLRARFAASIQAQQQLSLEAAHREAIQIYEQQEQLRQVRET